MKTALILAAAIAATIATSQASPFSNARYSNAPVNDSLARALAAPPGPHWPYGWVYVERPTQHYYANGNRYDYAWRGAWEYAGRPWVAVHGPDDDYVYLRPPGQPLWEPPVVYSRAFGAVVPFPVDYSQIHIVPEKPHVGYSTIEPAPGAPAPSPANLVPAS